MGRPNTRTHCRDCNVELDVVSGYITRFGYSPRCRECDTKFRRNKYHENKANGIKDSLRKYGITQNDFDVMLAGQWEGCAICKMPFTKTPDVDHDHVSGHVRGLLCRKCNLIVGYLENDEELILKATDYLKKTTWKEEVA
jgi:hypothetical protein